MKNIFTTAKLLFFSTAILLMLALNTNAQNKKISMQGFLKDANGKAIADGDQAMTFKIYNVATGGTVLWTEDQTVKVFGGVYSAYLGVVNDISTLGWNVPYFVGVTVQGSELTPRTELTYAPYSFGTNKANFVACSGAVGDVKYSVLNPTQFAAENGACWVPMDGRALATTDKLRQIMGWGNVPNAGGLFFRSQEYGGSNYDADRTTTSPIATLQTENFKTHNHTDPNNTSGGETADSFYYGVQGVIPNGDAEVFQRATTITSSGSKLLSKKITFPSASSFNVGGSETRSNNMNLFAYIRIN